MSPALPRSTRFTLLALLALSAALASAARAAPASSAAGLSAGLELRPRADAADLGLPVYPGATPRADEAADRNALTLALWGGKLGLRLVVMKLQSDAPIERVASFYQQALGRYGPVLDCSGPRPAAAADAARGEDDKVLHCDQDAPKADTRQYKAGVPDHHRAVQLKAQGSQVLIDLVRFELGR